MSHKLRYHQIQGIIKKFYHLQIARLPQKPASVSLTENHSSKTVNRREKAQEGGSMETQVPAVLKSNVEFSPGTFVIYGMHGKCQVLGTESRTLGDQSIQFYKLELLKASPSKSHRNESAIWVPIATAKEQGLRFMMTKDEAELALELLKSKNTFFSFQQNWNTVLPQLEGVIRVEGGIGLAKVASYLHVLRKKQTVPFAGLLKLQESVHKLLFRELSEILHHNLKDIELKVKKALQSKAIPLE